MIYLLLHRTTSLQITPERAERALRDMVFTSWRASACEDFPDTLKLISLIDFFLPYFPLHRDQVRGRRWCGNGVTVPPQQTLIDWSSLCHTIVSPPSVKSKPNLNISASCPQVEELVTRALVQWGTMLWHEKLTQLEWRPEVVAFLTDRVRGIQAWHQATPTDPYPPIHTHRFISPAWCLCSGGL